jgi:hypothetical protein
MACDIDVLQEGAGGIRLAGFTAASPDDQLRIGRNGCQANVTPHDRTRDEVVRFGQVKC